MGFIHFSPPKKNRKQTWNVAAPAKASSPGRAQTCFSPSIFLFCPTHKAQQGQLWWLPPNVLLNISNGNGKSEQKTSPD
jgi:hypothetical protein